MPIYEYQCQECGAVSEKLLVGGESAAILHPVHLEGAAAGVESGKQTGG